MSIYSIFLKDRVLNSSRHKMHKNALSYALTWNIPSIFKLSSIVLYSDTLVWLLGHIGVQVVGLASTNRDL